MLFVSHKSKISRLGLLATLVFLMTGAGVLHAADLEGLRLWRAPDHTRLVFDMSDESSHNILTLSNPERVVIDIRNVKLKADFSQLDLASSPISRIRNGLKGQSDLRVVLDLKHAVTARSFFLQSNDQSGDRLVVDLYDQKIKAKPVKVAADRASQKRDIIVAIDAGHGGEDPGAIGPGRVKEKQVVLAIANELKALLQKKPGYRPVMIRSGDYYVGLKKRRDLARKAEADLFISIHADAFESPKAKGASVYALSQRGATSASAKFLAKKENSADLIGGVSLSDKDDVLAGVLFDLSMTASLDASLQVGSKVLRSMDGVSHLHKRQVEQAGFAVLKSPDMPSILVETGFISNPGEAKKLKTSKYRKKMARAVYSGVTEYFQSNPPTGTLVAWQQRNGRASGERIVASHTITSGETLSGIAQRYRVSVADIKKTNRLAGSAIRIGQKLRIPTS